MSIESLRSQFFQDTIDPLSRTDADLQRRLINFQTGRADLTEDHRNFLDMLLANTPETREFKCHIYGYTSKLGDTKSNTQLAYDRANAICRYLESKDPRYTSRMMTFQIEGNSAPYQGKKDDNNGYWRAAEIHWKAATYPRVLDDAEDPGKPVQTHMDWGVNGCFSLMFGVEGIGQVGIAFFRFLNKETKLVHTFMAPMFGVGGGIDVMKAVKWLKELPNRNIANWAMLEHLVEKALVNTKMLSNPYGAVKEIGNAILTGLSASDWTDFTDAQVYVPIRFNQLSGKTVGNISATGGLYQKQRIVVYGPVWYKDGQGKDMFGTKDIMMIDSGGWQAQVPAISAGAVGGPLLLLR